MLHSPAILIKATLTQGWLVYLLDKRNYYLRERRHEELLTTWCQVNQQAPCKYKTDFVV